MEIATELVISVKAASVHVSPSVSLTSRVVPDTARIAHRLAPPAPAEPED